MRLNQLAQNTLIWNASNLHQALVLLRQSAEPHLVESYDATQETLPFEEWLLQTSDKLQLGLTEVAVSYAQLMELLRANSPAILSVPSTTQTESLHGYVVVLRCGARHATLLGNDGRRTRLSLKRLQNVFREPLQRAYFEITTQLLQDVGLPMFRRQAVREAYLDLHLAQHHIQGIWLVNTQITNALSNTRQQILRWLGLQIGLRSGHYILFFTAIALMGQASVSGRINPFWLVLGLLVWVSRIPIALMLTWLEHYYALKLGLNIKQQLFQDTLQLPIGEVFQHSTQYFHDVMETETLEESGFQRSAWVIASAVFLILVTLVLLIIGDLFSALILASWLAICLGMIRYLVQQYPTFHTQHKHLIHQFVENLRGHTTRLVQETNWFKREDAVLAQYLQQATRYDRLATLVWTLIPYGGVLVALLGIAPLALYPAVISPLGISLRLSLWLFAFMQLQILAFSIPELVKSTHAWHQIQQLKAISQNNEQHPQMTDKVNRSNIILELRNIRFRFTENLEPILNNVNLTIHSGETLWLQGETGSGKSTLATVLCHLRQPTSGVLLYAGNDQYTLNPRIWRKNIAYVSASAQNHILNGSLAYNLLMGRNRTPTPGDLAEAQALCEELGLGGLMHDMPFGIHQKVGETEWRLSHGERNRIFVARAILQKPDLTIIDENLVALDPENKVRVLQALIKYSKTLIMIDSE